MKETLNETRRYVKLPHYQGIRLDKTTGNYQAFKKVDGKTLSKTFETIDDAANWRNTFDPERKVEEKKLENLLVEIKSAVAPGSQQDRNGFNMDYSFKSGWKDYVDTESADWEAYSIRNKEKAFKFFEPLWDLNMTQITHRVFEGFLKAKKEAVIERNKMLSDGNKKYSFSFELCHVKAFFNWYHENCDPSFVNPITKKHRKLSSIAKVPKKNKKLSEEELIKFFNGFKDLFWRDLAETQFLICGRIGEASGLTKECVDLKRRNLQIKNVIVWDKSSRFLELKEYPKNQVVETFYISDRLFTILERRIASSPDHSPYVFTTDGSPIRYNQVWYQYTQALKNADLYPKYSGSHIMRHTMANITRKLTSSDHTQLVTRHKDPKMVDIYSNIPGEKQIEAANIVNKHMEEYLKPKLKVVPTVAQG